MATKYWYTYYDEEDIKKVGDYEKQSMKTILNSFTKTQTDSISKDISQNSDPNNIISTITLKKGRKAINIYISENYEEEKIVPPSMFVRQL